MNTYLVTYKHNSALSSSIVSSQSPQTAITQALSSDHRAQGIVGSPASTATAFCYGDIKRGYTISGELLRIYYFDGSELSQEDGENYEYESR